ncbi:MAG: hypothetical protein M1831_003610 [Alyxoria varia]|nr:MAG: hypothetical protein M1831_003610 [Alyxoria varia]
MAQALKTAFARLKTSSSSDTTDTPNSSSSSATTFTRAPNPTTLFPVTSPTTDGPSCTHDCASCTVKLPKSWKIDETDKLYGEVNGWETHMLVATGKSDWTKHVEEERGSVMEAVEVHKGLVETGRLMLSASNIPIPYAEDDSDDHATVHKGKGDKNRYNRPTTVLLLPSFTLISNVTPASVPALIKSHVKRLSTNTSPLSSTTTTTTTAPTTTKNTSTTPQYQPPPPQPGEVTHPTLPTKPSPHLAIILLCSQRTRDARCGQSAPLLRKELERHLRPLGLQRDLDDERPGGVGVYFISHVGGHKYAANVMVYRRRDAFGEDGDGGDGDVVKGAEDGDVRKEGEHAAGGDDATVTAGQNTTAKIKEEAAQCIWLARVRPEDCENIVRYTVLRGKVVKPERQLRGGFDRERGVCSW